MNTTNPITELDPRLLKLSEINRRRASRDSNLQRLESLYWRANFRRQRWWNDRINPLIEEIRDAGGKADYIMLGWYSIRFSCSKRKGVLVSGGHHGEVVNSELGKRVAASVRRHDELLRRVGIARKALEQCFLDRVPLLVRHPHVGASKRFEIIVNGRSYYGDLVHKRYSEHGYPVFDIQWLSWPNEDMDRVVV